MKYKFDGGKAPYPFEILNRMRTAVVRAARFMTMDKEPVVAARIVGQHGGTLADLKGLIAPDSPGYVVDRGYNGKRPLYYFPREEAFARGTHFGNQSSFRIVADLADFALLARDLLPEDYPLLEAGLEPVALNIVIGIAETLRG